MPRPVASDLALNCLSMPHKRDARLIYGLIHINMYYKFDILSFLIKLNIYWPLKHWMQTVYILIRSCCVSFYNTWIPKQPPPSSNGQVPTCLKSVFRACNVNFFHTAENHIPKE